MKRTLMSLASLVCGASLLLGGSGCAERSVADTTDTSQASPAALERVLAGRPERTDLKLYTSQPARIEAFEETPLFSKVAGYVQNVAVDIGDVVKQGEVLVSLWIPEMHDDLQHKLAVLAQSNAEVQQAEAQIHSAQASLAAAQARVAQAEAGIGRAEGEYQRWQAEYERLRGLAASGSVTQKVVDETLNQARSTDASRQEAAADVQSARAGVQAAEAGVLKAQADQLAAQARLRVSDAEVARAKTLLAYAEIKAPFDGVVTRRNVDTRHFVQPSGGGMSAPLLVVTSTDKVRVFVDVPEIEAPLVDGGPQSDSAVVRVQALGAQEFVGQVTRTSWSLDSANRSLRAEIDLPNADGRLRPGMYATASILLDQRSAALVLPVTAIIRQDSETCCCCVIAGKIERRAIRTGLRSGPQIEVSSGLTGDELVVLSRAEALQPGQAVEVLDRPN